MQPARKDDPNLQGTLPDPRLNPMINPRLGKNLGRWASVYYTTPPERRDEAVLELVRELEGGEVPPEESVTEPPAVAPASCRPNGLAGHSPDSHRDDAETQQGMAHENPLGPVSAAPEWRFCGHCGSPLKKKTPAQPSPSGPLLGSHPRPWLVEPAPTEVPVQVEDDSLAPHTAIPRHRGAQILVVLLLSMAIGAWGLRRIRSASAPQSAARVVPIVKQTATPSASVRQPRVHQTVAPPSLPVHDSSPKLSKPAAGTPLGCTSDHLSNCLPGELYRTSMSLADGIDARFIAYDKRMNQLLRDATAHAARTKPDRLRQANYSAQVWERLQLKSYSSHEKHDALKLRAELVRRVATVPKSEKDLLRTYENPQSCLELHYIADDLRRLGARLPKSPPYALRASVRRPSNSP